MKCPKCKTHIIPIYIATTKHPQGVRTCPACYKILETAKTTKPLTFVLSVDVEVEELFHHELDNLMKHYRGKVILDDILEDQ